ncbi:MAG: TetR/AcrR family transcriptional regulator [Thermoleophilia bacterium]|nr:TetR/AcrR family transcriptional regulator [Thermoleophilia bacterium]
MSPLRADAERNLRRLLDAAAEVFAEHGPEASVDEIARRAGVGHATVFRRFATKDELIAAVGQERIRTLLALAEQALANPDAGQALTSFVWGIAELHARERGLHECISRCEGQELHRAAAELVRRAQAAGELRTDVTPEDVEALVGAAVKSSPPDRWRQHLTVVLDGLKPR